MLYSLARPLLFALEPEAAHRVALGTLRALVRTGLAPGRAHTPETCARLVMGLRFPNPVGLAAGLDKNGEYLDALAALGFGFIEIGTVTPRPQPGNPRPRLFRLPAARALINRLGFNNAGVQQVLRNVRAARYRGVLGINIGKNADTPAERAAEDYVSCLRAVYPVASYVTVNVSSPNTPGLRALQQEAALDALLGTLGAERRRLAEAHGKHVPLAVKIAPDLEPAQLDAVARLVERHGVEAVIATNTTTGREGVAGLPHAAESGGLSGAPLAPRSNAVIARLARALGERVALIGVGGILSAADARAKIAAGARLVQLWTGLVYRGPVLVRECVAALCKSAQSEER